MVLKAFSFFNVIVHLKTRQFPASHQLFISIHFTTFQFWANILKVILKFMQSSWWEWNQFDFRTFIVWHGIDVEGRKPLWISNCTADKWLSILNWFYTKVCKRVNFDHNVVFLCVEGRILTVIMPLQVIALRFATKMQWWTCWIYFCLLTSPNYLTCLWFSKKKLVIIVFNPTHKSLIGSLTEIASEFRLNWTYCSWVHISLFFFLLLHCFYTDFALKCGKTSNVQPTGHQQ